MKVDGNHFRTIWEKNDGSPVIQIIDQRFLPHRFVIEDLTTTDELIKAIKDMHLRGAPLIGVAAAYAMYLAAIEAGRHGNFDESINQAALKIKSARPTAVNLFWAVDEQMKAINSWSNIYDKINAALMNARRIADNDVQQCRSIGEYGSRIIEEISKIKSGEKVNILTHCNAGWLATVDYGTATAPIYIARDKGIDLHVWVDETRPRNQGAKLTAWELGQEGIAHTVIADNTGGHLMQHGMVDIVIVGSDRTTYTGDVANKIGTYLKALAAKDNGVPFYAALPSTTIDWTIEDGIKQIPIEQRDAYEVTHADGLNGEEIHDVLITPPGSPAANYAFDVTPSRLVTGLITERGICRADRESILAMFPEKNYEL